MNEKRLATILKKHIKHNRVYVGRVEGQYLVSNGHFVFSLPLTTTALDSREVFPELPTAVGDSKSYSNGGGCCDGPQLIELWTSSWSRTEDRAEVTPWLVEHNKEMYRACICKEGTAYLNKLYTDLLEDRKTGLRDYEYTNKGGTTSPVMVTRDGEKVGLILPVRATDVDGYRLVKS